MTQSEIDQQVIAQFRAGDEIEGMHRDRLVLLTTTGSQSGESRTTPVMFVPTDGGILVIASGNASPDAPSWYDNLVADPRVHVELDADDYDATATTLTGDAREAAWAALIADYPFFADHQSKVDREIPLVELTRASASS